MYLRLGSFSSRNVCHSRVAIAYVPLDCDCYVILVTRAAVRHVETTTTLRSTSTPSPGSLLHYYR